jgi:class 3 adenylate cyclase
LLKSRNCSEEVMQVLETFHTATSVVVAEENGTVIHRAGDGVMIIFNDPIEIENPVARALALTTKLRSRLYQHCDRWNQYEYDLSFGFGVSYGYATLGLVGAHNHHNYTAIGTTVNLASRLCGAASDGEVLVTQRVCTEADTAFEFESLGQIELKGVSKLVRVFRLK